MNLKYFSRHASHYWPLLILLVAAGLGLYFFAYDKSFQIVIAVATAVAYVFWGIMHHLQHKDLYLVVVLEYLVVAILGLTVFFSVV